MESLNELRKIAEKVLSEFEGYAQQIATFRLELEDSSKKYDAIQEQVKSIESIKAGLESKINLMESEKTKIWNAREENLSAKTQELAALIEENRVKEKKIDARLAEAEQARIKYEGLTVELENRVSEIKKRQESLKAVLI